MAPSAESLSLVRFAGRPPRRKRVPREVRYSDRVLPAAPAEDPLDAAEQALIEALFQRHALSLADYRLSPLRRRIPAVLRALRAASIPAAIERLAVDSEAANTALSALLIGYSTPFRDEPVFHSLRERILPSLIRRRPQVRVWSAGCSFGVELRSVALLLAEFGALAQAELLGTDSRGSALLDAQREMQHFWKNIPAAFAPLKEHRTAELAQHAARIEWRQENILNAAYDERWDLILCRNVSIYLTPAANSRLWSIMHQSLAPDGILVVGKTERTGLARGWERIEKCIYQKVEL